MSRKLPSREQVPAYHYNSKETEAIIDTLVDAGLRATAAIADTKAQLFVDTATWGLALWEQSLGIPVDEEKDAESRRSLIKAKLRGSGVTTKALVLSMAESYSNGQVEIIEYPDQYRVEIQFVGTIGVPPNMGDLMAALREIIPAHVALEYTVFYSTWDTANAHTWDHLANYSWDEVKELNNYENYNQIWI